TRLSPSTIILEKYLGRLISMLSFLMLGLPILAFAYSLGGVSPAMFINGLWLLLLAMLQIAALGVLCSSYFRTTVAAFIATYLLGFLLLFGLPIAYELNLLFYRDVINLVIDVMQQIPYVGELFPRGNRSSEGINFLFFAPYWFDRFSWNSGWTSVLRTFVFTIPIVLSTFVFLMFAHYFLVRRAFLPSNNMLLNVFKKLDGLFSNINNNRVTRGIVLVNDNSSLPESKPIAWRETSKKSLGTFRYLFRILVFLEVPILFLCIIIATSNPVPVVPGAVVLLWLIWGIAVLFLAVSATSLIAGERSHETLDVLLTTPISGSELLDQKIAGVKRLCRVLMVPLLTIILFEGWWKWEYAQMGRGREYESQWLPYLVGSLLTLGIYLPMLVYLFCWIGMKIKSQTKAILTALGSILVWCLLPFILAFPLFILIPNLKEDSILYGLFLGPASYLVMNEVAEFHDFGSAWIPLVVNTVIYGGCLLLFRTLCRNHIDENLGRLGYDNSSYYRPDYDSIEGISFDHSSQLSSET
ncbi:MAG: ABC transporter permease subunit, partial [Planctomycetaceae bacterium]|nr:ABC transporter permease subunit [Planctomycetaceae bacterium]